MLASLSLYGLPQTPKGPEVDISVPTDAGRPGDFPGRAQVVPGFSVSIDLWAPQQWRSLSLDVWDPVRLPLLAVLIGATAVELLTEWRAHLAGHGKGSVSVNFTPELAQAGPGLRVAVLNGLDRWLQLALDQSLIDAERSVATFRLAQVLAPGQVRESLVAQALTGARFAAKGLGHYLGELTQAGLALPAALVNGLQRLTGGYGSLLGEVHGDDHVLEGVVAAWETLSRAHVEPGLARPGTGTPRAATGQAWPPLPEEGPGAASALDPRRIGARLVAVGEDPQLAEVAMLGTKVDDGDAVLVRVPAFRPEAADADVQALRVRLIERSSGESRGEGLLRLAPADPRTRPARSEAGSWVFQGTVRLDHAAVGDVRADVFDLASATPAVLADNDQELQRARRATVFLREWRQLAALALLEPPSAGFGERIERLAATLARSVPEDEPIFRTGPSVAGLRELSRVGDETIVRWLRRPELLESNLFQQGGASGELMVRRWVESLRGSGALMVAELAAAYRPG